ncbi:hypothetical protein WA026_009831 [Henosepilachna vigintioctopunctata]|uniref:AB hydrolase-1 domain-containing protein n=1 Tax=Henosepilachna vigintioctopunctata TaxID=420089 RepID=A0AAW1TR29_9CUCU
MSIFKWVSVLFFVSSVVDFGFCVKVCSSWKDYWGFSGNNTCRENLDDEGEFSDIVSRWGKKVQTYVVSTYDGYYITLFRIVPESNNSAPVLLLPGSFMNSIAFVDRKKKSLAHQFAVAGYDVWFINWRGTRYSRHHISLTDKDSAYWKFSFNEWGTRDLWSALNKIKTVNSKKVLLVGLELGTTAAFIYASEYPDLASENLSGMVSMSPITVPSNAGYMLKAVYTFGFPYIWQPILDFFYHGEFPASIRAIRATDLCKKGGITLGRLCDAYFEIPIGLDLEQQDPETLPVIIAQNKDSEPVLNYQHMGQILSTKTFAKLDYGPKKNIALYGQDTPPVYNLSKIRVPQLFYLGLNDKFGTVSDASVTYQQFSTEYQNTFHVIDYQKFGLADFVQAKDINSLLHEELIKNVNELIAAKLK